MNRVTFHRSTSSAHDLTLCRTNRLHACARSTCQKFHSRKLVVFAAQSDFPAGKREKLPIFPLGLVALPGTSTPLQIFEARYRVLFSTLLDGADGIEDGLVSPDKPWKGSRRFGMAFYDPNAKGLAAIGTVLEIQKHSLIEDGRLIVDNIGKERFKIIDVVEERPVLVCEIEYLQEDDVHDNKAVALSKEVAQLFKDVVKLSAKLKDAEIEEEAMNPPQLDNLNPRETSFWIASLFGGNPYNQQALLEEDDTMKRLEAERELLSSTLKYLSAQSALQSAFKGSGDDGGE